MYEQCQTCVNSTLATQELYTSNVRSMSGHSQRCTSIVQISEMRQLLFGKQGGSSQLPWPAWKQGFFFCTRPGLSFGLVQQQGGPCGLLAAMQVSRSHLSKASLLTDLSCLVTDLSCLLTDSSCLSIDLCPVSAALHPCLLLEVSLAICYFCFLSCFCCI